MTVDPIIEFRGISRTFVLGDQQVRAVDRVDLRITAGEYLSIMGPSGSGKSTLLNLIALLDRPTMGSYRFDGRDITQHSDDELAAIRRHSIGFIFQSFHLVARLNAHRNVELPLLLAELDKNERRRRVEQALSATKLLDRADHRPHELSGGQRQRVAIARAIVMNPKVILADEPTGNLDAATGDDIVALLESLHRDVGVTLIMVTHDSSLGARAARHLKIADGRIASDTRRADARD